MRTSEEKRKIWRERKRRYRQNKKAEQTLRENIEQKLKEMGYNPIQDFMPEPRKGNYKERTPSEYCQRCGHHKFYCTCKERSLPDLRIWKD